MAWDPLTTANVTVGNFWTGTIAKRIKDCLEYLYSIVGTSAEGLINGGFEVDSDSDGIPDGWTQDLYPGGVGAYCGNPVADGALCWAFIHPGGAGNGGGSLTSDYIECSEYRTYSIGWINWATAAGMHNAVTVQYYTSAKVANGAGVNIWSSTTNPATPTRYSAEFTPTASSRFLKIILVGGYTDADVAGTALFDKVTFAEQRDTSGLYNLAVTEAKLAAAAVAQGKLKTATGDVHVDADTPAATANCTLPGGEYGFYPQIKATGNSTITASICKDVAAAAYATIIYIEASTVVGAGYAQQRYVTSSGEVFWVFLLRDKSTKRIASSWAAPDHPCMGNGGKPLLTPHPFPGYNQALYEIIVINPTNAELRAMEEKTIEADEAKPDRSILDVILEDYEIDDKGGSPDWPTMEVTVGLPRGRNWKLIPEGSDVIPIKKVIPRPDHVITARLKLKDKEVKK